MTRTSALAVISILGVFALVGLAGTIWLIANKAEGSSVAIVSGLTGTALGGITGLLSQTEKAIPSTTIQQADNVQSGGPNVNSPDGQAPRP